MRAIGYLRVKSGAPESLVEQEKAFFSFCEGMGYEPVATFVDVEVGEAGNFGEYQRMLRHIRGLERGFLAVLVKSLEQLGADYRGSLRRVLELEQLGARVLCTERDIADPVAHTLEAWTQTKQHEALGAKVKNAMKQRAMFGAGLGKPPFGYRIGDNRRLEVQPEEAEIVKLIFHLYIAEKIGIRLIARHLNEHGITTRKGGRWSMVSIRDILRNRAYLGTYNRFGVRIPGSHAAIVSAGDLRAVQERLESRRNVERVAGDQPFLLAGLAYCGYCGNKMIGVSRHQSWTRSDGSRTKARYRYYQCQSRTNQSLCDYHTRRSTDLEASVAAELAKCSTPQLMLEMAAKHVSDRNSTPAEAERLKARLGALARQLDNYLGRAGRGEVTPQQLRNYTRDLLMEKMDLEERLSLMDIEAKGRAEEGQRWRRIIGYLEDLTARWQDMSEMEKRSLLREVVDRVTVFDDHVGLALKW